MMREIQFRAWGNSHRMIPWEELRRLHVATVFQKAEGYHLMQFTGLRDKNGKEIYEGDLLQSRLVSRPLLVRWWSESAGFNMAWIKGHDIEVIGNLYETPELLK